MAKLIRRDMSILFANWQVAILLFLLMPFVLLIIGMKKVDEVMTISMVMVGYFFTTLTFSYELRIKPYLLIQSLPLTRSEVVISRYMSTFINFIIGVVYTVTYLWIIKYFRVLNVDIFDINVVIEAFLILIIALSISLPGYFILRPKAATILNTAIYIIGINLFVRSPESNLVRLKIPIRFGIPIMVLYFISLGLSIWFYERKDLA